MQGSYNDMTEDVDPRGALLISNTFADGKFGALLSVAYTERQLLDEGSSTVRWQNALNTDGTPSAGAAFGPHDPSFAARLHAAAQLKPRSVRAFRVTTSTSTIRNAWA